MSQIDELSQNPEDPRKGPEINANGTIQVIFAAFFVLVAVILSNLVVGLTVNKTDELFKRADIYQNIKRVKQIDELENLLPKMSWRAVQLMSYLDKKLTGRNIRSQEYTEQSRKM